MTVYSYAVVLVVSNVDSVELSSVAPDLNASTWDVLMWSFDDAKCGSVPSRVR